MPETVLIDFGTALTDIAFEKRLAKSYMAGLKKRTRVVVFDWTRVEWCETFPMTLSALWIGELMLQGKQVEFRIPAQQPLESDGNTAEERTSRLERRVRACSYLAECLFINFLFKQGVLSTNHLSGYDHVRREKAGETRICPLTALSGVEDLETLLKMLSAQKALEFGPMLHLGVVRSGEIRTVILRELGDNIFDHAGGRLGFLSMSFRPKLDKTTSLSERLLTIRQETWLASERQFFQSLGSAGYATVVIGDKGSGIPSKIRDAYFADDILPRKKTHPTAADLVHYAFLRHSSSKPAEKRLVEFRSLIEEFDLPTDPATGLHWVREITRTYRGLLTVRTENTIVSYDYLNYPERGHPDSGLLTQSAEDRVAHLASFGGVQFKLIFPADIPVRARHRQLFFADIDIPTQSRHYVYLALLHEDTHHDSLPDDSQQLAAWLNNKLAELNRLCQSPRPVTIVVNCEVADITSAKALKAFYLFTLGCMRVQSRDISCVFVDANLTLDRIAERLNELAKSAEAVPKERVLMSARFRGGMTASVHGLTQEESLIIQRLTTRGTLPGHTLSPVLRRKLQPHLEEDPESGEYRLNFSAESIARATRVGVTHYLRSIAVDERHGIIHKKGCYLIPSGAFASGYIELSKMLSNEFWASQITRWIQLGLELYKPDRLVVVGRGGMKVILEAIKGTPISATVLSGQDLTADALSLKLLPRHTKVCFITDVIGTQRSINRAFESAGHLDVLAVMCFADARNGTPTDEIRHSGGKCPMDRIISYPLQFWFEDKPAHFRYEDIVRVDPVSSKPIEERFVTEQPIWRALNTITGANSFVSETLKDSNAPILGHFENRDRHLSYLFSTPAIASVAGPVIAEVVREDVERFSVRELEVPRPGRTTIVYPAFTPGAEEIARQISAIMGNCAICAVGSRDLQFSNGFADDSGLEFENVIVFDDALFTGYTARQLIEFSERNGARNVFVYILCNRASRAEAEFLQKIVGYGRAKIHVRYLAELPIPTFDASDCPICRESQALTILLNDYASLPMLSQVIRSDLLQLQIQPTTILADDQLASAFASVPLSNRISLFEVRAELELARTSVAIRKKLAEMVRDPQLAMAVFQVIAYERSYFLKDERLLSDVFYESFRRSVISAAQYVLKRRDAYQPRDVGLVASVALIFDPDLLSSALNDGRPWAEEVAARCVVQLLLGTDATRRIRRAVSFLASVPEPRSTALETLQAELNRRAQEFRPTSELVNMYRRCWRSISDHSRLSNLFGCLEFEFIGTYSLQSASGLLQKYWPDIAEEIDASCLRPVLTLIEAALSKTATDELVGIRRLAVALVQKVNELSEVVRSEERTALERQTALEGLHGALNQLFRILLEESDHALPNALEMLRTELGSCLSPRSSTPVLHVSGTLESNSISEHWGMLCSCSATNLMYSRL